MNICDLRVFKAAVEAETIKGAAIKLNCSSSKILNGIKKLEEEFQVKLFFKKSNSLFLTSSGKSVFKYTLKILCLWEEMEQEMTLSQPKFVLKLGIFESSSSLKLSSILSEFHRSNPEIKIEIVSGKISNLLKDLCESKLDGVISAGWMELPNFSKINIYKEKLILLGPASLKGQDIIDGLKEKKFLLWNDGCPYRSVFEEWCEERKLIVPIITSNNYSSIIANISCGTSASFLPEDILSPEQINDFKSDKFFYKTVNYIDNYFLWNPLGSDSPIRNNFIEFLKKISY